jgi:hypothetical protein
LGALGCGRMGKEVYCLSGGEIVKVGEWGWSEVDILRG